MDYCKYNKKYMYDKINNNMLYVIQPSKNEVFVYIDNGRDSIMKLSTYELEEELTANNLVIGEADAMRLLYGKSAIKNR